MPSDRDWSIVFGIYGISIFVGCVIIWEVLKFVALFLYNHLSWSW